MTMANAPSAPSPRRLDALLSLGFPAMLAGLFLFFSLATPGFLSVANIAAILHALAPISIIAAGLSLVVITGNLDISVGSIAFLSVSLGWMLFEAGVPLPLAALAMIAAGALLGAVNAFVVVVLRVNSLITTLGTMIAFRGLALELVGTSSHTLPAEFGFLGNLTLGPVFLDSLLAFAVVAGVHLLHRRLAFGRQVSAVGNGAAVAAKIGVPVGGVLFGVFVISGALAALGGLVATLQVGALTAFLGRGLEFNAIAVIVVGGISLFGGSGNVLAGVLMGAVTFEMIRNGLNHLDANPYAYRPVSGVLIFLAMYADSFRHRVRSRS